MRERGQGLRAISVASLEGVGEAGGGQSRVEVAHAWRAHALVPSGTRLKTTGAEEVDWAGSTGRATEAGKAQVLLSFSLISVF